MEGLFVKWESDSEDPGRLSSSCFLPFVYVAMLCKIKRCRGGGAQQKETNPLESRNKVSVLEEKAISHLRFSGQGRD